MKNQELAKIFNEIADYLSMDEVPFKPYAYQRAALALSSLEKDVEQIYKEGGLRALEEIPAIGKSMALRIEEYIKTKKIEYYEVFKKRLPLNLEEIISVEGVGPKRAKFLYQKLGISNLKDLEKAARSHKIAQLFGFGTKTEQNILQGIEFVKRSKGRFLLGEILPRAKEVFKKIEALPEVDRLDFAGSIRRRKETIGDVDLLAISKNPDKVMDFFVSLPGVVKIWGKGKTKASIRMAEGFDMDLRVVPRRSYGAALQYFTGSKEHNIVTRKMAMGKGLKLSEYGLFRGAKMIASENEEGVYEALGLEWMEPELRENTGEIEAATAKKLPKIVSLGDIKGDLHCHSNWDGGHDSLEELAESAQNLGYKYLGISDHTKFLRIEKGLDEERLDLRNKEIEKINEKLSSVNKDFTLLKGAEVNILKEGKVDIKDESLEKLDFVIAGIHSNFKMGKIEMTERMINAMKNKNIDIISHPTGRILKRRDEYEIDIDKILRAAREFNVALEINASPQRLDLNDINIKKAKKAGVKMIINSDAHQKQQLSSMEFGVSQARRGWAEKEDVLNTRELEKLKDFFNK